MYYSVYYSRYPHTSFPDTVSKSSIAAYSVTIHRIVAPVSYCDAYRQILANARVVTSNVYTFLSSKSSAQNIFILYIVRVVSSNSCHQTRPDVLPRIPLPYEFLFFIAFQYRHGNSGETKNKTRTCGVCVYVFVYVNFLRTAFFKFFLLNLNDSRGHTHTHVRAHTFQVKSHM